MATKLGRLGAVSKQIIRFDSQNRNLLANQLVKNSRKIYTESGGIQAKPLQVSLGLGKVTLIVLPFVYVGSSISKMGAAFLEENEIFVPDDDDD